MEDSRQAKEYERILKNLVPGLANILHEDGSVTYSDNLGNQYPTKKEAERAWA